MKISTHLEETVTELDRRFKDCGDVVRRELDISGRKVYVSYIDSMIDREMVEGEFLWDMMYKMGPLPEKNIAAFLQKNAVATVDTKTVDALEDAILEILSGNTAILSRPSQDRGKTADMN